MQNNINSNQQFSHNTNNQNLIKQTILDEIEKQNSITQINHENLLKSSDSKNSSYTSNSDSSSLNFDNSQFQFLPSNNNQQQDSNRTDNSYCIGAHQRSSMFKGENVDYTLLNKNKFIDENDVNTPKSGKVSLNNLQIINQSSREHKRKSTLREENKKEIQDRIMKRYSQIVQSKKSFQQINKSFFKQKSNHNSIINPKMQRKKNIFNFNQEEQAYLKQFQEQKVNCIITFTKCLRFIKILQDISNTYRLRHAKVNQLKLLGDKTYYPQQQNQLQNFANFFQFKAFDPQSQFVVIWQIIKFIIILWQLFYIPLRICFDKGYYLKLLTADFFILDLFMMFYIAMDIFIQFNIGIYIDGVKIMDKKIIRKTYFKGQFFIDLCAQIGIYFTIQLESDIWLILFLMRVFLISKIYEEIENMFQLEQKMPSTIELTKLIFTIIIVAHYCSILFYGIAIIEINQYGEQNSWLQEYELYGKEWDIIYVESFYFLIITMSTVGYGDLSPSTYNEKIIVIIITIISCGVFAFAVNTVGQIFRDKQIRSASIKKKKYEIMKYMRKRNISKSNQVYVIKQLEYIDQLENNGNIKGLQVLNSLPQDIQHDVIKDYYGKLLNTSKFAKISGFSKEFLIDLSLKMTETTIGPASIIFQEGQKDDKYIFLLEGTVEMFQQSKNKQLQQDIKITSLKGKLEIGYNYFFQQTTHVYSIRSVHVCRLAYFKQTDFLNLLQKYPDDYEQYFATKDRILYNMNTLPEKCHVVVLGCIKLIIALISTNKTLNTKLQGNTIYLLKIKEILLQDRPKLFKVSSLLIPCYQEMITGKNQ